MSKAFTPVVPQKCPWHQSKELPYMAFFRDAEKRDKEGQRQVQCRVCGYWFWPDEFGVDPISQLVRPKRGNRVRYSAKALKTIQVPRKLRGRLGTVVRMSKDKSKAYVRWDGTKTEHPIAVGLVVVVMEEPVKNTL